MRVFRTKKGDTAVKVIVWIVRLIFAIVVMLTAVLFVNAFIIKNINLQDAESHIFVNRLLYSRHGISEVDGERVLAGTIDEDKLGSGLLEEATDFRREGYLAANISYDDASKQFFYHKDWFDNYRPLAGFRGPGGTGMLVVERLVVMGGAGKGMLFEVLTPNAE